MMRWRWYLLPVLLAFLTAGCGGSRDRGKGVLFFRRGKKLVMKKDYEGARAAFEECVRRQPDYAQAHLELGMLSEEPFQDPWAAARHYREFVRLSPEHADRPTVKRWLARAEERLLVDLAERYPGTVVDADVPKLCAERDDLLLRLRRAAVLYATLRDERDALTSRLAEAERKRVAALRERFNDDTTAVPDEVVGGGPKTPPRAPVEAKPPVRPVPTHTIVNGDTLAAISRQYYGSIRHWPKLQAYNRDLLRGGTVLVIGKTIRIPPLTELTKPLVPRAGEPKK
jgi:tetratricopeptide (TPR) repeat protein